VQRPESQSESAQKFCSTAAGLVGGDRDRQHGAKADNFARIATMWNAYLAIRRTPAAPLDAVDVGHMMAVFKVARTQSGSLNIDDYIDGAGYLGCAGEVALAGGGGNPQAEPKPEESRT
jgi:hypothetical protein